MKELTGSVSGQSGMVLTVERLGTSWASVLCLRNAPRNKIFEAMQCIMLPFGFRDALRLLGGLPF